ncbi:MAG: nitronate monooxygenase [Patescibacteria group bacterium]
MLPSVTQGGMGVNISTPSLANACSRHGKIRNGEGLDGTSRVLGTVSCVGAERVLARILQSGDLGGHYRRALEHFPFPGVASRIIERYFVEGGIPADKKFKAVPVFNMPPGHDLIELTVAANFAFVWLAKEGHPFPVSVNYLEKIRIPLIYGITGAMLAGVDYITMGAGMTLQIPAVLDALSNGEMPSGGVPSYRVQVEGSPNGTETISFNPSKFFNAKFPELIRPGFLPIVSTDGLASLLARRLPRGSIQGFVIELPTAGGHNAPPRGKVLFNEKGEPVYGPRDRVNFVELQNLNIPFWIGGSCASPEGLQRAKELGANGIQVGSIFALCEESGMDPPFRREIRRLGFRGELIVRTDPKASPTGYPFKVVQLPGTLSSPTVYDPRERVCDLGLLRVPYQRADGTIGFRCSAEPVEDYISKGGKLEDTAGACCICNGLMSAAGFGNPDEPPIFTLGDDVSFLRHLMRDGDGSCDERGSYSAADAIEYLLKLPVPVCALSTVDT